MKKAYKKPSFREMNNDICDIIATSPAIKKTLRYGKNRYAKDGANGVGGNAGSYTGTDGLFG